MPRSSAPVLARRPLVLAALLAVVVLVAAACDPAKANTDYALVNALRAGRGVPALSRSQALDKKAADHAAAMAARGTLFHSNLGAGVPAGWKSLGENVAMAGSVEAAQQALEASPPHLANLVNPAFNEVGVGVKTVNGVVYLVQVFAQR